MKLIFTIDDEKTIVNETVKVTVSIQGQVGEDDRSALEARAREIALKFLPEASWAFSNFILANNGMMFNVTGTTRIDALENDQLAERANELSDRKTILQVQQLDPSVPLFQIRKAQSEMRVSIIAKAQEEAKLLGGFVKKVDFTEDDGSNFRKSVSNSGMRSMASSSYALESVGDGSPLGHSEKILMSATITAVSEEVPA